MAEISPEQQAQMDEQKKQCPFCKIVSGEMESKSVYKDNLIQGVLDINPWTNGHVVLMPKEHYPILPVIPPDTFKHIFSVMPKLVGALKNAMLCTGSNVFIANGGVAGQQSPHFLLFILPRENGDKIYEFNLDNKKSIDNEKLKQVMPILKNNLPLMMSKHFQRNPPKWNPTEFKRADFIKDDDIDEVIYEDKKTAIVSPKNKECVGHLVIYSQEEESLFENLEADSSLHLFFAASLASTAVFEGMGAHGSNIILKSGISDDNTSGKLSIHILPRFEGDGINILPKPIENKKDLGDIASKIKDKTFEIEHSNKPKEKTEVYVLDEKSVTEDNSKEEHVDEITKAINMVKGS